MNGFFEVTRAPRLGLFTFDAVTESKIKASNRLTRIALESGVEVNDHRIPESNEYIISGAMSNSPLKQTIDDLFTLGVGAVAQLTQYGVNDTLLSLGSAYLAGSDGVRAPTAAALLMVLKESGEPINISTGLILLKDMVIEDIEIDRNPDVDNGFIFTAKLVQFRFIKSSTRESNADQLDESVREDGTSTQVKGAASTESVGFQSWADDAISEVGEWMQNTGSSLIGGII